MADTSLKPLPQAQSSLRRRILAFVGALIVLSVLGSTFSLYRITQVDSILESLNRVSVPLGRLFAQMETDADVFRRELDRALGQSHWNDPHWRPHATPRWIEDVLGGEVERMNSLLSSQLDWAAPDSKDRWREWAAKITTGLNDLRADAGKLSRVLEAHDSAQASQIYPRLQAEIEDWRRQLQWGATEYERAFRQTFSLAQNRVSELRTGLEMILVGVVGLSLLLLWLGERALRPLSELTRMAREIASRGLRKEDKSLLPEFPLSRSDEVSQLGREFHRMATALLEREKTVEIQKHRVEEQNRLLKEIGELNENILDSIDSILIVADLDNRITQCNPVAARWLEAEMRQILGSDLLGWRKLSSFAEKLEQFAGIKSRREISKIEPSAIDGRIYGGHVLPLKQEGAQTAQGLILVLGDLTDELDLEERLRRAENLAAVGRMSAQVAHEVRNPLHSIGLEAEMAAEMAQKLGQPDLKQSLQSILSAVDRLEKITENYLKLSRLSAGKKTVSELGEILDSVLATYAPVCESQGVRVDWKRQSSAPLDVWADRDLLEQVLGNLFRNALQALETLPERQGIPPAISWTLGHAESGRVWIKIQDNGPGIAADVRDRLFTPFFTTRAQGTGLGLSFIKKVMEDHGGSIICQDRQAGSGACFELVMPGVSEGIQTSSELSVEAVSDSHLKHASVSDLVSSGVSEIQGEAHV